MTGCDKRHSARKRAGCDWPLWGALAPPRHYFRNSSGNLAKVAAIGRASSRVLLWVFRSHVVWNANVRIIEQVSSYPMNRGHEPRIEICAATDELAGSAAIASTMRGKRSAKL